MRRRSGLNGEEKIMFELLILIVFGGLLCRAVGFALRLTWGAAKIAAGILMVLALPLMVICVLFAGGLVLLLPVALIAAAVGILRACM